MYCCLFKKVTVHNTAKLSRISSNCQTDSIGIGGTDGFVKVVKIELVNKTPDSNPLTFSQNLVCHKKKINVISWNDQYDKLTTSDEEGVIVVWRFSEKGQWETEMINNREVSWVTHLKWSKGGEFLCFVYDDGHAIVGTAEGSRCWGNDIKDKLYRLEWSPDSSSILFACKDSNIIVFSSSGYQIGEMEIEAALRKISVITISWWTNPLSEGRNQTIEKHLMIAFQNGVIHLYNDTNDTNCLKIKTSFDEIIEAEWNPAGDIIAVAGFNVEAGERKDSLFFYSSSGALMKTLKIPNTVITSFCWDSLGTKLAITTESLILFSLVKAKYHWAYFADTLVYCFFKESEHHSVIFWSLKSNSRSVKYVKNLIGVSSYGSFCLIISMNSATEYIITLNNSIGSPVDSRVINFRPIFYAMNSTTIVLSDHSYVYIWQYMTPHSSKAQFGFNINITLSKKMNMKEYAFFIEDTPNMNAVYSSETFNHSKVAKHQICTVYTTNEMLLICLQSGKVLKFNLPLIGAADTFTLSPNTAEIGLSFDYKFIWTIDDLNNFSVWSIEDNKRGNFSNLKKNEFEKKEVWGVLWSEDDSANFALIEKNRLNIIKNFEVEEIQVCNGYLSSFSGWEITVVNLEHIMKDPLEEKSPDEILLKYETNILKEFMEMIESNKEVTGLYKYVENSQNKKLWTLFARHAMLSLDFNYGEKAFLKLNDYLGLTFIKRIKSIDDDNLKRAEVYQFFLEYDKAESVYNSVDRKDLIISMRIKLGHWEKVVDLIKESGYAQEDNIKMAYNNLAIQYVEDKEYEKAESLYNYTNNYEALVDLYFRKEEYENAAKLISRIPENDDFLIFLGEKFESFGLCEEAVQCYLRYGDPKKAIDACILMNNWNLAVSLAEKNNFFQIEALVNKFCSILIEKNKKMDLVELYRKAHRHTEAAKILVRIAEDLKVLNTSPIIMKKIYIVAALEVDSFKSRLIDAQITEVTGQTLQKSTLDTLITSDLSNVSDKALNNPWKGAEAYHFYMLCQSQLYQNNTNSALKTALRLVQYEKELSAKEVYRLIALSAFLNKSYKECSKALSKLENANDLNKEEKEKYGLLAVSIFTKFDPQNQKENQFKCPGKNCESLISEFDIDCKNCGSNYSACVMSGQSIFMKDYVKCRSCKHKSLKAEVLSKKAKFCSLCHVAFDYSKFEA